MVKHNYLSFLFLIIPLLLLTCSLPGDPSLDPNNASCIINTNSPKNSEGVYVNEISDTVYLSLHAHLPELLKACTLYIDTDTAHYFQLTRSDTLIQISHNFLSTGTKKISVHFETGYTDSLKILITGSAPHILIQPVTVTAKVTTDNHFSVTVNGSKPIHFQWFKNDSIIPGKTADTLYFRSLSHTDDGVYFCKISNILDTIESDTVILQVLDTSIALPPVITASTPTNTLTPSWKWKSGGNGTGFYRYSFDGSFTTSVIETKDTLFKSPSALAEGPHTLYIQEKNMTGVWSARSSFTVTIDITPPVNPAITFDKSPTNNCFPIWRFSNSNSDIGFRYKLDSNDFSSGAVQTDSTSFTPKKALAEGAHTLYVQTADSAGNWSVAATATIVVDTTAPAPPVISANDSTNSRRPQWTWTSGKGGCGEYRYRFNDGSLIGNIKVQSWAPNYDLTDGINTLYVQEMDSAGNWSSLGTKSILCDYTKPLPPQISGDIVTNNFTPAWRWGHNLVDSSGCRIFKYKIDSDQWSLETTDTSFVQKVKLKDGIHTFYVQERDNFKNWSDTAKFTTTILPPAPDSLNITTLSDASLKVSWIDRALTESRYWILWSDDSTKFTDSIYLDFDKITYTLTGLKSATKYYFRAYAWNSQGKSLYIDAFGKTRVTDPVIHIYPATQSSSSYATISCATQGATIYYNTGGNFNKYSSGASINTTSSSGIKAYAEKAGFENSLTVSAK